MVRPATVEDAPRLQVLCGQLGYEPSVEEVRLAIRNLSGDRVVVVACDRDEVVAWIELMVCNLLTSGREALICGLVVDEKRRGHKIGEILCNSAETWAREKSTGAIRVRSRESRIRAHEFYRRLGYDVYKTQLVFRKSL